MRIDFISKLFWKKPSEAEILNTGLVFAMEFGENWLKPIQQRLFKKYNYLTKEQLDNYNSICKAALNDGVRFMETTLEKISDQKQTIQEQELKDQLRVFMLAKYPWIDRNALAHLFNQGCYYNWKEGLSGAIS
ncbi:MAG TPA: hypothetical protein VK174_11445 [Chitinophagales bacterium]|nr:hypothetical protein [Chitinophagales bacterium]HLP52306.1 hypothetical protein [Chitinophagales bacterium]